MENIVKNVEFYDWKLNGRQPFSCLQLNYERSVRPRTPDMHSALHLGLVLQGECEGEFAGERVCSKTGEFYLTAPWEPHCTVSLAAGYSLLLLNIDLESLLNTFFTGRERLETLLMMTPERRMKFLNEKLGGTPAAGELTESLCCQDAVEKELLLWNLIQNIFIKALPEVDPATVPDGDYRRLLPALKGLSGQLLSADEAAQRCNLSVGYFSVLFKKQFGMSFGRYERNFRLNGAENALRRGCSLKEAADLWGFCDKSHLSRLLKQRK